MKILHYVMVALIAVIPKFWIEDYTVTNPIWWTVVLAWIISNAIGYLEGIKKGEREKDNEEHK